MNDNLYEYAEEYEDGLTEEELLGFRASLSNVYRGLTEDELEDQLIEFLERMMPAEAESFRRTLANIGQTAAQIGSQLLPTLGTTVGTMISPGIGTAVGRALGNIGGQLLGRAAQRRSPTASIRAAAATAPTPAAPVPEPTAGTIPTGAAAVGTATGSAAVAQLLQLLQTPQIQQALASARLGQAGAQEMTVGSSENATSAPPAAFLNLVSSVANRAAMEVARFEPGADFPGYLEGAGIDLANPDERARVLWERFARVKISDWSWVVTEKERTVWTTPMMKNTKMSSFPAMRSLLRQTGTWQSDAGTAPSAHGPTSITGGDRDGCDGGLLAAMHSGLLATLCGVLPFAIMCGDRRSTLNRPPSCVDGARIMAPWIGWPMLA